MVIENPLQVELARLFMLRYKYTQEQLNRCLEYITNVFVNETYSLDSGFLKTEDYRRYLKETGQLEAFDKCQKELEEEHDRLFGQRGSQKQVQTKDSSPENTDPISGD